MRGMKVQGKKAKGQGCCLCGDPNIWNKECPKGGKGRMSAVTSEEKAGTPVRRMESGLESG